MTNVYNNVYVNKTVNVTNITYQNQRSNNAVTATSQASFTSAQPVGRNMMRVDAREVSSAPVAPIDAERGAAAAQFVGAGAEARVRPPANVLARPVVAKTTPPPAPVARGRQMQEVQANGGRPVADSQIRQTDTADPAQRSQLPRRRLRPRCLAGAFAGCGQRSNKAPMAHPANVQTAE